MSDLADTLVKAFNDKEQDINRWMWKMSDGSEIRMMDLSPQQLQQAYKHVLDMLNNKDPYHPGVQRKQYQVRKMWDCANVELLLRHILYDLNIDSLKTNKDLLDYISSHKKVNNVTNSDTIDSIFTGLPSEYNNITIDDLISACLDTLPAFNRKLIPDKFILSLGIWLTEQEKKDLTDYDSNGRFRNRKDVIKERLFLNPNVEIRFNSKGLSYNEFRSLLRIEGRPRFSMMPTDTIKLLRDKVLLILDQDLEYHVQKWSALKEKLELVAAQKGVNVN